LKFIVTNTNSTQCYICSLPDSA